MEKSLSFINRVFSLRPGDFGRGLPLFGYYFLIIASYVMCQTVRVPLFLDKFKTVQLPYVDIAVAALVPIVIAVYMRVGKNIELKLLLVASLIISALITVGLWWATTRSQQPSVAAALYIWVGIFGVLAPAQVWTLANFVWTTREAKRMFGLLAGGGTAGNIFAGFFSNYMAPKFGTESLLLVVALFVALSGVLVVIVTRQHQQAKSAEETQYNLRDSLRVVQQSPHLQAIAALICLSSIVTTAVGWQFNAIAKQTIGNKDALAAFLGAFAGYTGIGALIAQVLLTGTFLRRFGVGTALLVLPVALAGGTVAVITSGTLLAATMLRGTDKVVRYSIDKSGVELLYLPVSTNIKLQAKSFVDTVIWRLGDGIAGLTVLLFANILRFTPRQLSWVTLPLLALWITAAWVARKHYVGTLKANIQSVQIRTDRTSVPVLDQATLDVFAEKLSSLDVNEVMYALNLFEMAQHLNAHAAVRKVLDHPSPHVRRKAISILNAAGDLSVRHRIADLLRDNSLEVRTEALLYLSRHEGMDPLSYIGQLGEFADFSIRTAIVSFLMRAEEGQNIEAARLITNGIVADLGNPTLTKDAERALVVLGEIAATVLADNLIQPDAALRSRIIATLNKLCEFHRNVTIDRQLIESAMLAELMGHYRSYQILAASNGNSDESLKQSMEEEVERIFRLMKLLFPTLDLQNAYAGIQSHDPVVHANALEFLDNTLSPQLRARLVPMIDAEVSLQERVQLADRFLGFSIS